MFLYLSGHCVPAVMLMCCVVWLGREFGEKQGRNKSKMNFAYGFDYIWGLAHQADLKELATDKGQVIKPLVKLQLNTPQTTANNHLAIDSFAKEEIISSLNL